MTTEYIEITTRTDNPWVKGPVVQVCRDKAEAAAVKVRDLCESLKDREFKASWDYDPAVHEVLNEVLPTVDDDRWVALAAVVRVLGEMVKEDGCFNDWYAGPTAAFRSCRCLLAYTTPGFLEARRNAVMANN